MKFIVKLFASSWYIFLTYIYDARSHLHQMVILYGVIFYDVECHVMVPGRPGAEGYTGLTEQCEL